MSKFSLIAYALALIALVFSTTIEIIVSSTLLLKAELTPIELVDIAAELAFIDYMLALIFKVF